MHNRMLVFGEDRPVSHALAMHLRGRGYEVLELTEVDGALASARSTLDAVVINLGVDRSAGLSVANAFMARSKAPLVLFTALRTTDALKTAIAAGTFDCISVRPLPLTESPRFDGLMGSSALMTQLFGVMAQVAATGSTVLIGGESGTGKELVANAIHKTSSRAGGRFVPINCGALSPTLFESELFGHVRGAFTDARADRKGAFRDADGGTVFLDEVSEIPIEFQPRLLRVLQERTVRPVGADFEVPFDARIIAATGRDLWREVQAKRFREDLYFRLNVVHLQMPPLRKREGDITMLAQHFIANASKRAGKSVLGLDAGLSAALGAYVWPGNVRELQNVIERAVVMTRNTVLGIDDLPPGTAIAVPLAPAAVAAVSAPSAPESLLCVERRHVLAVIAAMGGNHTRAAKALGIDRVTLYRKLKSWGLPEEKSHDAGGSR